MLPDTPRELDPRRIRTGRQRRSGMLAAGLALAGLGLAACDMHRGAQLPGRAVSDWTRSYTLQPGGEFQVVGNVGSIDVQASNGPTIEVRAERIVHAATNEGAADAAERVRVTDDVSPDKVVVRNDGLAGILVGIEIEVNFHVTVPPSTRLRLHTAGGNITLANVNGVVVASSTNGSITGTALGGGIDARSTNGTIVMDLAAVGVDPVDLRATNGGVTLTLPATANANVEANCTNGSIDLAGLSLTLTGEQSKRRARGRLNNGGAPVELTTTNGDIHVRPRP